MLRKVKLFVLIVSAALMLAFSACDSVVEVVYPMEHKEYIELYSSEYEIPPELLCAVILTESGFDHEAKSGAGAVGLMQLLPSTAEEVCEKMKLTYSEVLLTDPESSIKIGAYYLRYLYNNTGKNWDTACAAYNAGIGNVKKWQRDSRYSDDGVSLKEIPIAETRAYVKRINEYSAKYKEMYFTSEGEIS